MYPIWLKINKNYKNGFYLFSLLISQPESTQNLVNDNFTANLYSTAAVAGAGGSFNAFVSSLKPRHTTILIDLTPQR